MTKRTIQRYGTGPLNGYFFCIPPVLIIIAAVAICVFATELTKWQAARYLFFQLFGILVPGLAVTTVLLADEAPDVFRWAVSYGIGYGVVALEYILLYPLGLKRLMPVTLVAVAVVAGYIIWKKKAYRLKIQKPDILFLCLLMAGVLYIFLNGYVLRNLSPGQLGYGVYYLDSLFTVGNIASSTQFFPPVDIRLSGSPLFYYWLLPIHEAVLKDFVGTSAFILYFSVGMLGLMIFLTVAIYGGIRALGIKPLGAFLLGGMFLFGVGRESLFHISFLHHIYVAMFGMETGLSLAILSLVCFVRYFCSSKKKTGSLILAIVFFALTDHTKGPVAALILAGVLASTVYLFMKRVDRFKNLAVLGSISLIFCVSLLCFQAAPYGEGTTLAFDWFYTWRFGAAASMFTAQGSFKCLADILNTFYSVVAVRPAGTLLFISSVFMLLSRWRTIAAEHIMLFFAAIAGIGATTALAHISYSQIYFIEAAIVPMILLSAVVFSSWRAEITEQCWKKLRPVRAALCAPFLCLLLLDVSSAFSYLRPYIEEGKTNLKYLRNDTRTEEIPPHVANITAEEYHAMLWLRENTPPEAVVMSDRYSHARNAVEIGDCSFFLYSAFSERRIYLEGYRFTQVAPEEIAYRKNLVDKTIQNDAGSMEQLVAEGVQYFIKTHRVNPGFSPPEKLVEKIFQNRDITIYRALGMKTDG